MLEIERKFVAEITDRDALRGFRESPVRQGYLVTGDTEVRIRDSEAGSFMAIKVGKGLVRREIEFRIQPEIATALWPQIEGHEIHKTRYHLNRWELDTFRAPVELVLIEIELESEDERLPVWPLGVRLLYEVTNDLGYTNQSIAKHGAIVSKDQEDFAAAYHIRAIRKGTVGELSKIREELEELEDATVQGSKIMQAVELADLFGAVVHRGEALGLSETDLSHFSTITRRAFANGGR